MATISFPVSMPWDYANARNMLAGGMRARLRSMAFEHEAQQAFAPEQGGRFVTVQLGPSLWRMQVSTPVLSEPEFSVWRSWFDVVEAGAGTGGTGDEFIAYDVRRPMPWNNRNGYAGLVKAGGANPFEGTAKVSAFNSRREEITNLSGSNVALPQDFQFEVGDYVALRWVAVAQPLFLGYSLHRIALRPAAANSSGVTTIHVRPRVHPDIPATSTDMIFGAFVAPDAEEGLRRAGCLMRITRRDRSAEQKSRSISFEAVQSLRFK